MTLAVTRISHGRYTVEIYTTDQSCQAAVDIGADPLTDDLEGELLAIARDHDAAVLAIWKSGGTGITTRNIRPEEDR
jgi:hypothetical protein